MKTITVSLFFVLLFTGCIKDSKELSKEECKKSGYKHAVEKKLNYRSGKYELKFICLNTIK